MTRAVSYSFLMILALVMAMFYWGASVVERQQEVITSWMSNEIGHPIEIAEIKLSWVDISPQLELKTIKVMAKDNTSELMSLETLYLDLNLFSSLWFENYRLDEITAIGLNISIVRDSNGELYIQGLKQDNDSSAFLSDIINSANSLNSLHLKGISVDYSDQEKANLSGLYQIKKATLNHSSTNWQGHGQIFLPELLGDNIEFSANWILNPQNTKLMTWQGTLKTNDVLIPSLSPYLNLKNITLENGLINSIFRAEGIGPEIKVAKLDLELSQAMLTSNDASDALIPIKVQYLSGNFHWEDQKEDDESWILSGNDINLSIKGEVWPETSFLVNKKSENVMVKSEFFRIESLIDVAVLSDQLPEQVLLQNPSGDVEQLEAIYHLESGLKQASFDLKKGKVSTWGDYPGVTNLNASVLFYEQVTKVEIASEKVTIHPVNKLDGLMIFDEVTGELEFEKKDKTWRVQGDALKVKNDEITLQFSGSIEQNIAGKIINDIEISFENVAITRWQAYFPEKLLSAEFKEWSKDAFLDGVIEYGEIKLEGDIAGFPYETRAEKLLGSFDMALKMKGVVLHYSDNWPDLINVTGSITGQGNNLVIKSQEGLVAGFSFDNFEAKINGLINGKAVLTVEGSLLGKSQQAINFVQSSPLKQRFASVVDGVSARGESNINLNVTVPLSGTDETQFMGDINFIGSDLYHKDMLALGLTQLNGMIRFDNKGMISKNIKGQFLNQSVDINIFPKGDGTVMTAEGALVSSSLPKSFPNFITGQFPYLLEVIILERNIGDFYVDATVVSNLEGAEVALPGSFYKKPEQSKKVKITFKQTNNNPSININYDDTAAIKFESSINRQLFDNSKLNLVMSEFDAEMWLIWFDKYRVDDTAEIQVDGLSLETEKLIGYGQQFSNIKIEAVKERNSWLVSLAGQSLEGELFIPEVITKKDLLKVDLEKLKLVLPKRINGDVEVDEQYSLWPSMSINIDELTVDNIALGNLKLISHEDIDKWVIDSAKITSEFYSLDVSEGIWHQSTSGAKTELALRIDSHDFTSLIEKFGFEPRVEAEKLKLLTSLSWKGGPMAISEEGAKGSISFKLEKGKLKDIEPGPAGRAFGLLSIATIQRRLSLDFNELFAQGLSYRTIKASFDIDGGLATTKDFSLKGGSAEILIEGTVDLVNQQYNQKVKVRPNVSSTLPLAGAVAAGPIGLGVGTAILLADKIAGRLFDKDIVNMISYDYLLTGSWKEPNLQMIKPFLPGL